MKKLMFVAVISAFTMLHADDAASLKEAANNPAVAAMASEDPDGCQVFIDDDGSMKIISTGTGVYDFADEDEIADARKEATRNAKAHIVKFFKEKFSTEEEATNATKKAKSLHSDGENETVSVSKEQLKTTVEVVKSGAEKVLAGVVVLKDEKIPSSKKGGTIRVTVGVSSTTLAAATKLSNGMTQSVHDQDNYKPTTNPAGAGSKNGNGANGPANTPKVRKSRGAF